MSEVASAIKVADPAGPKRWRGSAKDVLVALAWGTPMGVWLVIFFLAPLILLCAMSFWVTENYLLRPALSFRSWSEFFTVPFYIRGYLRTLVYSSLATGIGLLIGYPVAYALAFKVTSRVRTAAIILLIAPFFSSYLVKTYVWRVVLSNNGLINSLLKYMGAQPIGILDTPVATMIGYLTYSLPVIILIVLTALMSIDRSLIEASHNLGAGRASTFLRVVLPMSRVGLAFAGTFMFVSSFGDFIAPALLGGGRPPTISILVIDTVKSAANWPGAAVVAVVMMVTLLAVTMVGVRLAGVKQPRTR